MMNTYPDEFIRIFGEIFSPEILKSYIIASGSEALTSVRLNSSRMESSGSGQFSLDISSVFGPTVPWCSEGRFLTERPYFTSDPHFQAGLYYVQDSSSMFLSPLEGMIRDSAVSSVYRALDLCAAPGGKSTLLASVLCHAFGRSGYLLVSNEVMKQRVNVLADNMARWGDMSSVVTSNDPSDFAVMDSYFDLVLADVPCSGEGMFRKDMKAIEDWSPDNVKLCASRQRRIIADMWPCLKEGGLLVYSTCTYNREENDLNVRWISEELGADIVDPSLGEEVFPGVLRSDAGGFHFIPGLVPGEGQYFAVLRKKQSLKGVRQSRTSMKGRRAVQRFRAEDLPCGFSVPVYAEVHPSGIKVMPEHLESDIEKLSSCLKVIRSGLLAFEMKGKDLVPAQDLPFCSVASFDFPSMELDRDEATAYMARETVLPADGLPKGYVLLKYGGIPLGFAKNIGSRMNNMWPMSRRILRKSKQ